MSLSTLLPRYASEAVLSPKLIVPTEWKQGRTLYGGLSTALAYHVATQAGTDHLLRSVQIAFAGPLTETIHFHRRVLRRGRNTDFIAVDVLEGETVGVRGLFLFASERESSVSWVAQCRAHPMPKMPEGTPAPRERDGFSGQMDYVNPFPKGEESNHARPRTEGTICTWVRLREPEGLDPWFVLLLIADALPPAAFHLMQNRAPISSMTWQIDLLVDRPITQDGWWLLESRVVHAIHGTSSQVMTIWNHAGEAVANGIQSVALFG